MNSNSEPPLRSDDDHDADRDPENLNPEDTAPLQGTAADLMLPFGRRLRLIAPLQSMWEKLSFLYRRLIIWWFGYDFFISYCHESEGYCQALYNSLSDDYVCFRDRAPEGILAGERLGDSISAALCKSRILVLIWSPAVATNEWPRAESRFFSVHSPHRRLILICPTPYSDDMPNVLFASPLPELQTDLERWLRNSGTIVPESLVPDSNPRAIVEELLPDLRGATPSADTIRQLYESHDGASVPRKARRIVLSASSAVLVLAMGLWMYYAAESAREIVTMLQQAPYDSQKISESDSADASSALGVSIYEATLQAAARQHQHTDAEEWNRICRLLDDYHFYHWWSSLGWGDQGIMLQIRGVPDVVATPSRRLPKGIVDLRLSAKVLTADWVDLLSTATETQVLGISTPMLLAPEQLATSLQQMNVTDLRIEYCSGISRQWFTELGEATLGRLRILRLSLLPDLSMVTPEEQQEFSSVLLRCTNLNQLALEQLNHCRFSKGFFRNLIQQHKSLCEAGFILVDPISLPTGESSLSEESVPGCKCRIQMPELEPI